MSRFGDYDDYEGEPEQILAMGRWERNARAALKGRRGRKALAELREALMALPEHKLIEGALCTVGAGQRKAALLAEAERDKAALDEIYASYGGNATPPAPLDTEAIDDLDQHLERDGEGVCGMGAYIWYQKVKAGLDPAEAFASLPTLLGTGDGGLEETASLAAREAGVAYTLAWELAYRNDETWGDKTPEERHAAFIAWIDRELAGTEAA